MGKKKVTSSDIARAAGVSQATVSMILNKKYNVSFTQETIERVERRRGIWDMWCRREKCVPTASAES